MKKQTPSLEIHPLIKGAIRDAMIKALKAKPVMVHVVGGTQPFKGFVEMDGEIYSEDAVIEKIIGCHSWWK